MRIIPRNPRNLLYIGAFFLAVSHAPACGPKQGETLIASSAQQASYAARYPDALQSVIDEFNRREEEVNGILADVPQYPQGLQDPNWMHVLEVYDAAVVAGRSQAYADRIREVRHVHTFFEEEKDELNRRAGGAAQYAAQQGGCTVQVGGAVGAALAKAVDKQLEMRLRDRNEAHLLVMRYEQSLGEKNATKLAEQADHLSYISFMTFVETIETKQRVDSMIQEADEVQKTADAFIAEEEAFQNEPERTDKEKAASAERVAYMKEAKAKVASAAEQASATSEQMKERIEKLQKDFDYIVGALRTEVQQRADRK